MKILGSRKVDIESRSPTISREAADLFPNARMGSLFSSVFPVLNDAVCRVMSIPMASGSSLTSFANWQTCTSW